MKIVKNVLDSVPKGTTCAFILPDKKLEKDYKDKKYGNKLLKNHTLSTIIKLPENLFFGIGLTTSIFVFRTGTPQKKQNIIGYYIEEDGLETVKNKGRQDIKNRWKEIEDYWITAIHDGVDNKHNTRQIINPQKHLSYQMPEKEFELFEEDFIKTMVDYELFKREVELKDFKEKIANKVLYVSDVNVLEENITITMMKGEMQ